MIIGIREVIVIILIIISWTIMINFFLKKIYVNINHLFVLIDVNDDNRHCNYTHHYEIFFFRHNFHHDLAIAPLFFSLSLFFCNNVIFVWFFQLLCASQCIFRISHWYLRVLLFQETIRALSGKFTSLKQFVRWFISISYVSRSFFACNVLSF